MVLIWLAVYYCLPRSLFCYLNLLTRYWCLPSNQHVSNCHCKALHFYPLLIKFFGNITYALWMFLYGLGSLVPSICSYISLRSSFSFCFIICNISVLMKLIQASYKHHPALVEKPPRTVMAPLCLFVGRGSLTIKLTQHHYPGTVGDTCLSLNMDFELHIPWSWKSMLEGFVRLIVVRTSLII